SKPNIRNNWDLSTLRASSVEQALQQQYGVDPKRLTAGGRGEYNPIADNSTPEGKARNRRTQIIITPKLDQFMELIDKAQESAKDTRGIDTSFWREEIMPRGKAPIEIAAEQHVLRRFRLSRPVLLLFF